MFSWKARFGGHRQSDRSPLRSDRGLARVIAGQAISVLFQPQIEPRTGRVRGVEALARWDGSSSADALFQRAASGGLAERLSRLVQGKALRTAAAWEGPLASLDLSINLLPQDLARSGFDDWLIDQVALSGIDPRRVTVEIIESAALVDLAAVAGRLSRLRASGIRVALDDFGTGYASLSYLAGLPLDSIKLDRGLIAPIVEGQRDRTVVQGMIRIARDLGLKIVVEGVESIGQLELLADWGVDLYQGFLGAGALDEAELGRFVSASRADAAA